MWVFTQHPRAASIMPLSEPLGVTHGWAALGLPEMGWLLLTDKEQCQLCPDLASQPCQMECLTEQSRCAFCAERIVAGSLPRCVGACPHGAIWIGNLERNRATNGIRVIPLADLLKRRRFEVTGPDRRRVILRG